MSLPAEGPILVTGGSGFVGKHLVKLLRDDQHDVVAPSHAAVDLLDEVASRAWIDSHRPAVVVHLAALASVGRSWKRPTRVLLDNITMTANVLEAVRRLDRADTTLVLASSGEVYGSPVRLPIDETAPLSPMNPYAVSKCASDLLAGQYATAHDLRIVRLRPFNHAGPGQSNAYLVGTLARQIAAAQARGDRRVTVRLGNLDVARDFTDVRDVVRAYADATKIPTGVYNVCSGRAIRVSELIEASGECTDLEVVASVDPERSRPSDTREIVGSNARFVAATDWRPSIPIGRTLKDSIDWWTDRLATAPIN